MIKSIEVSGRTEDEALAQALRQLGMERDEVSVTVLERSKSGFLGIGAQPAVLRIEYEVPDEPAPAVKEPVKPAAEKKPAKQKKAPAQEKKSPAPEKKAAAPVKEAAADQGEFPEIRAFLSGLLERMGIEAEMEIKKNDGRGIIVNLSGPNMGAVIGRRGETLDAIQHLTNYVVNRGSEKHMHISFLRTSLRELLIQRQVFRLWSFLKKLHPTDLLSWLLITPSLRNSIQRE